MSTWLAILGVWARHLPHARLVHRVRRTRSRFPHASAWRSPSCRPRCSPRSWRRACFMPDGHARPLVRQPALDRGPRRPGRGRAHAQRRGHHRRGNGHAVAAPVDPPMRVKSRSFRCSLPSAFRKPSPWANSSSNNVALVALFLASGVMLVWPELSKLAGGAAAPRRHARGHAPHEPVAAPWCSTCATTRITPPATCRARATSRWRSLEARAGEIAEVQGQAGARHLPHAATAPAPPRAC